MGATRQAFLEEQLRSLSPLDVVVFGVRAEGGVRAVEVMRDEAGSKYLVEVGGDPPLGEEQRRALESAGFGSAVAGEGAPPAPLRLESGDAAALAATVEQALAGPLGAPDGGALDVRHASRKAEVEMRRKVDEVRQRVGRILETMVPKDHLEVDADNDFTFPFGTTRVWVAPRSLSPVGPLIVKVIAVTNIEVEPSPMLGLFLSSTNFGLPFGRFSLDTNQRAVWFEETLLGDYIADDELRFTVEIVASTADEYDDRIAATFGGRVFNAPNHAGEADARPAGKPGADGYL